MAALHSFMMIDGRAQEVKYDFSIEINYNQGGENAISLDLPAKKRKREQGAEMLMRGPTLID